MRLRYRLADFISGGELSRQRAEAERWWNKYRRAEDALSAIAEIGTSQGAAGLWQVNRIAMDRSHG